MICPLAKQTKLSFNHNKFKSLTAFKLLHIDIWGPYEIESLLGEKYFITIVDDYIRATWTFVIKDKTQCSAILKNFFKIVNTQFGTQVKTIRIDNGTEFFSNKCTELATYLGIIHQRSSPYTPQQNSVIERKYRHLLKTARATRFQAGFPKKFWVESVLTTTYVINRMPMQQLGWVKSL